MEIFVKILYGLMFFCMGVAIIRYRKQVYEWTGKFSWAERYLWSGGTVIIIMLLGCVFIFLSIAYPLGALDGMIGGWPESDARTELSS